MRKRYAFKEQVKLAAVKRAQVFIEGGVGNEFAGFAWFCFVVGFLLCNSNVYSFVVSTAGRLMIETFPVNFQVLVNYFGGVPEDCVVFMMMVCPTAASWLRSLVASSLLRKLSLA